MLAKSSCWARGAPGGERVVERRYPRQTNTATLIAVMTATQTLIKAWCWMVVCSPGEHWRGLTAHAGTHIQRHNLNSSHSGLSKHFHAESLCWPSGTGVIIILSLISLQSERASEHVALTMNNPSMRIGMCVSLTSLCTRFNYRIQYKTYRFKSSGNPYKPLVDLDLKTYVYISFFF